MKKIPFLLFALVPFAGICQKKITGQVFNLTGNRPLAQASVVVSETGKGTVADSEGKFSLTVPENGGTISASYAGFETRHVRIEGAKTVYLISLRPVIDLTYVSVIGSRNLSRTKIQTAVPVDIIPVAALSREVGQTDLNQLLTYTAPSFQSSRQTVSDGTDHVDPAQLRGLGSDQVLVLINGKRRHQSALVNVNGTVNRGQTGTDLNTIPIQAIDRVEILRDGAAAQYGSDAIAGVINIVLKKSVNTLSGNVSYGENVTSYEKNYAQSKINHTPPANINVQDGGSFQAGLNYGFNIKDRGYLNLTGDYSVRQRSNRTGTYTGVVYANIGGSNHDDSILNARGLTRDNFDMRIGNSRITAGAVMFNGGYALNDQWNILVFGGHNQKNGEAAGFFRYPSSISSGAGIYADQALALYPNGFLPLIKTNIKDYSLSAALSGTIGRWKASFSNTIGINRFDFQVDNSLNYTQFAITDHPQVAFDAGGLQFLQNTINADLTRKFSVLQGMNVAYGAEFRTDQYAQHEGEEASYKNFNTAANAASGAQVFAGFVPQYAGQHSRHNIAVYADVEQDLTRRWMAEIALRFENYSDFGSTLNYKIASRYKISDAFIVRAAASSGFRAPSMQQRFYAKTNTIFVSTSTGLTPVESGTFTNDSKAAQILGIPKLREETSQNYSFGFTATPLKGLEISADAYLINIKNRIVLTNNFSGGTDSVLTSLLKNSGATTANFFTNAIDTRSKGLETVISYTSAFANDNRLKFSLSATFIKNEAKKGADGKPMIKASDILINSGQYGNYFNREDQSRIEVAQPRSKGNFTINYYHKKFGAMLRLVHFGKVIYLDPSINPANDAAFPVNTFTGAKETLDQEFASKTVTDVSLSYDLTRSFTITAGSDNLFDVYQDKQNHSGNVSLGRFIYSRRVQQMGFNGRFLFARLSWNIKNL